MPTTKTKITISLTGTTGSSIVGALFRPLVDGSVVPRGIELVFQEDKGLEGNTLRMLEGTVDVGDMALGTFTSARAEGRPVVALPVFSAWHFVHTLPTVRIDSDIRDPAQLKGRKVGLHQYWNTDTIWVRSIFRQFHGVEPKEITWITHRPERLATQKYPPGVKVTQDQLGRDTPRMLLEGEVDAVFGISTGGRARPEMRREEIADKIRYLYPDVVEAQRSYYRQTRIFPFTHVVAIREELASTQPGIVRSIYEAFVAAKEHFGVRRAMEETPPIRGGTLQDAAAVLAEDPYPYGIEANRHGLETFLREVLEQGLIDEPMSFERFYASNLPDSAR